MAWCEAERRAFSRPIIVGAFGRRGLWPFSGELMKATVRANLGFVATGETAVDAARHAASEVIQAAQARVNAAKVGSASGKATLKRGVVHSPFILLQQRREADEEAATEEAAKVARREGRERKKEDNERVLAEKAEARESRRCRVCAGKVHRGGDQWVVCPCDAFWVCPGCAKLTAAGLALSEHIKACARRFDSD